MIDASKQYQKGRSQNTFEEVHRKKVFQWYSDFKNVNGAAKIVDLSEIASNDWNLNIPTYVEPVVEEET